MDRRKFIGLAAFATPAAAVAADEEQPPYEAWWGKTETLAKFDSYSPDRGIVLSVELTVPPEKEVTESHNDAGELTGYQWKNIRLPADFMPGSTYLTKFHLVWDGKEVPIPEKFWNDLARLTVVDCKVDIKEVPDKFMRKFFDFVADLYQPRVIRSMEGGTALIEWNRSEECDSSSTIRWMVSRSGTVLRHRTGTDGC
ncbi:hypothetical protein OVA24_09045 [Luteolibacter sp. SL250]|uniref:hypothetical protein n=1 Tax=Luteolibacter sp. SL250 TaxID=2995170 RepID=UPI00226F0464|nr:hypothetical protein [Luteolibacter sp. SL250]WAC21528.1 hypothetical protein OVA24_09045 [Luteolibacter sp. SL250]